MAATVAEHRPTAPCGRHRIATKLAALAMLAALVPGHGLAADRQPLKDEMSRGERARYAMQEHDHETAAPIKFVFPDHAAGPSLHGIDVSHHQGEIAWPRVLDKSVVFAFVKATQGATFYDEKFDGNWKALDELRYPKHDLFRGAYHFMSADDDPVLQAEIFLAIVGELAAPDLPATLDMEWDFTYENGKLVRQDGKPVDAWARYSSEEIVDKALKWLQAVEAQTGRKPIIYTNLHWWQQRIGQSAALADYPLWVADYSSASRKQDEPRFPSEFGSWDIWQMTDSGHLAGVGGTVDVNRFRGADADFRKLFGLPGGQ